MDGAGLGARGCMHVFGTMYEKTPKSTFAASAIANAQESNTVQGQNNVAADG